VLVGQDQALVMQLAQVAQVLFLEIFPLQGVVVQVLEMVEMVVRVVECIEEPLPLELEPQDKDLMAVLVLKILVTLVEEVGALVAPVEMLLMQALHSLGMAVLDTHLQLLGQYKFMLLVRLDRVVLILQYKQA
jgi:hypothetical protein